MPASVLPRRRSLVLPSFMLTVTAASGLHAQDLGGEPLNGTVQLDGGFSPDPWVLDIVPGGDTAVADHGAGCSGFIFAEQPDLRVEYEASEYVFGIFVNSSIDTTLVVNDPDGTWHCNDDAAFLGNSNPGIEFGEPLSGVYDVWVGTYADVGAGGIGKLVLTERDSADWAALNLDGNGATSSSDNVEFSDDIDFGDDLSTWAGDGECDDPRFTGEGAASTLLEADRYHDATDCAAAWAAGTIRLAIAGNAGSGAPGGLQRGRLDTSDPALGDGSYVDRYTFDGSAGSTAVIDLRSSEFDTYLRVTAPSGEQFTNDDYAGATDRSLLNFALGESGAYTVEVTSYAGGETGAYTLDMSTDLQAAAMSLQNAGTLAEGDPAFSDGEHYDVYTFEGQPGQSVTIDLNSGDFDTYLVLEGPDGQREVNDDSDGTSDSRIVAELSQLGTYTVYVTSYAGGETGTYTIAVDQRGAGSQTAARDPIRLAPGEATNASLDAVDLRSDAGKYEDLYSFDGVAGARLQVDMRSSAFDTWLSVIGPDGQAWENDDFDGDTTHSLVDVTLPQSGRYRIVATSYASDTTGAYQLALSSGTATNGNAIYLPTDGGGEIYGIFAGIADYPGDANDLDRTDQDALRARDALLEGAGMAPDKAWTLLDGDATTANFAAALRSIGTTIGADDTLVIFYSGHGGQHARAAGPNNTDPDGMDESLVLYDGLLLDDELAAMLDELGAGRVLLVFDSCFSGGFAKDVVSAPGRMGLFSSEEDVTSQVAYKFEAGGYLSVFFEDAVRGRFADGDMNRELTAMELSEYIHERYRFDVKPEGSEAASARVIGPAAAYQHLVVDRGGISADSVLFSH
ncbi:MAG: pre-peptidase C-terminal domain-containing protein [Gammaproteobacteria bacterium]